MRVSEKTITNFQLKQLFEEFNAKLMVEGITPKFSWFLFKNTEAMAPLYNKLMLELYDERREEEFPAMYAELQQIEATYCDKDLETDMPITDAQGNKQYNEKREEYTKAFEELREKFKDLFERIDNKPKVNQEIFAKQVTFNATLLDLTEFPNQTKPYIIGLLGS